MTDGLENAWKLHAAQVDWTGKVDAKASFAFAIHSAAFATLISLRGEGRVLSKLSGYIQLSIFVLGCGLILLAALAALKVVIPRLRSRSLVRESATDYIHFGHARHWAPSSLAKRLTDDAVMVEVLSRQIVRMADIAWIKHRWVQASMTLGASGAASVGVSAVLVWW